jgi:hypothetical protein
MDRGNRSAMAVFHPDQGRDPFGAENAVGGECRRRVTAHFEEWGDYHRKECPIFASD